MIFAKKFFASFALLLALFTIQCSLFTRTISAEGEFRTDFDVTYEVKESGITNVINKITLTNNLSDVYATSYSVVLNSISPKNIKAYGIDKQYSVTTTTEDKKTIIKVTFPDTVVGKDKSRVFFVTFEEPSFAVKTGEVWEIQIPRISEEAPFSSYNTKLLVPESLGQEAYISPEPKSKLNKNGFLEYNFDKSELEKTGVVAGFGAFQVFTFNLSYHLENPLNRSAITEISLPPDTAYQKVYYGELNPKPYNMYVDSDGNWIAEYKLEPRERIDVITNGHVQIFSNYRPFLSPSQESLLSNLKPSEYWDINNSEIIKLRETLKTPKQIYDFVSSKLKYDYSRVKVNVERFGGVKALENPLTAICMEFTDLFITLARSSGIPAREINGYAYTENPEIQPLSLVNDVLHAWPEYYDFEKKVWIPVDPTWGSTTGGVDYFSKLDLRHFTFAIHGKDSKLPYAAGSYKLGNNPQKDVYVSFGTLPEDRNQKIVLSGSSSEVTINNMGLNAIYGIRPRVFFDNVEQPNYPIVEVLLPFQSYKFNIDIPFSVLGTKTPNSIKVVVNESEILIPTNKRQVLFLNLLVIFLASIIILLIIVFKLKKWKFQKRTS